MWDDIDKNDLTATKQSDKYEVGIGLIPNIVGEYSFTDKWIFFGGAQHYLNPLSYSSTSTETSKTTVTASKTNTTVACIGVRFSYENFAAEAALSDTLFSDGPSTLFNGKNLLGTFGAFIYF